MKLEAALNAIHSQTGRKTVVRNALFGAISGLRAACFALEGMTKSISVLTEKGYHYRAEALRNSDRFTSLTASVEERANRAYGIYCLASASFDIKPEFEPGIPKHLSQEQLAQIADFSGLSTEKVAALRNAADNKRYAAELEARSMTEAMFWSATPDEDPEVKAEGVMKALQQSVQFIATWSNPDFAELGVLKYDIQLLETIVASEANHEDDREEPGITRRSSETNVHNVTEEEAA